MTIYTKATHGTLTHAEADSNMLQIQDLSGDFTATGNIGSATLTTTGNATIGGTLVESSAAIYKENIEDLPNQLANIMKLRPVEYDKIKSGAHEIGLIADEVQEILPELVQTKDGKAESLSYTRMVSVLVKAVQELTEKVEKLSK